jgi:hypothetical protein
MLHALPFTTFGEAAALGLEAHVYCPSCCGGPGSVTIRPAELLTVGGEVHLAFLWCDRCLPPWQISYVPIHQRPWNIVNSRGVQSRGDRFSWPRQRRLSRYRHRCERGIQLPAGQYGAGAIAQLSEPKLLRHRRSPANATFTVRVGIPFGGTR